MAAHLPVVDPKEDELILAIADLECCLEENEELQNIENTKRDELTLSQSVLCWSDTVQSSLKVAIQLLKSKLQAQPKAKKLPVETKEVQQTYLFDIIVTFNRGIKYPDSPLHEQLFFDLSGITSAVWNSKKDFLHCILQEVPISWWQDILLISTCVHNSPTGTGPKWWVTQSGKLYFNIKKCNNPRTLDNNNQLGKLIDEWKPRLPLPHE